MDNDAGAAKACFVETFDQHVKLQEDVYLVQHEESQKHGKLKGISTSAMLSTGITFSPPSMDTRPIVGAADAVLRTHAARITRLRALSFPDFLSGITAVHKPIVLAFAATVLQMLTVWVDSTCLRSHATFRDAAPDDNDDPLARLGNPHPPEQATIGGLRSLQQSQWG